MALSAVETTPRLGQYLYGKAPSTERLRSIHRPMPRARSATRSSPAGGVGDTSGAPRNSSVASLSSSPTSSRYCRAANARTLPWAASSTAVAFRSSRKRSSVRSNPRLNAIVDVGATRRTCPRQAISMPTVPRARSQNTLEKRPRSTGRKSWARQASTASPRRAPTCPGRSCRETSGVQPLCFETPSRRTQNQVVSAGRESTLPGFVTFIRCATLPARRTSHATQWLEAAIRAVDPYPSSWGAALPGHRAPGSVDDDAASRRGCATSSGDALERVEPWRRRSAAVGLSARLRGCPIRDHDTFNTGTGTGTS